MKIWQKLSKFLPILFLIIFTFLIFKPFFIDGKIPVPADTIVGMYHPWRDFYKDRYPLGMPFKNFQITDAVRQQFPWRELSMDLMKNGQLPLWNPYSFAGAPLLGNLQSAPFYPLNLLYLLGDFTFIWSLQVMLQVFLGGLFMWLYLRHFSLGKLPLILGTLSWAGCGFFTAWLEWNTAVHTLLWLPLLLLSIEKIFDQKNYFIWSLIFLFSLCSSFLAGYLQPFFYVFILINAYIIYKLILTKQYKLIVLFPIFYILFSILTFPQWFETFKFIGLSARDVDQANWTRPDWFLPWQNLAQFIAPDYFGNPATLNYFGVWNYQEFVGYVGIVALLFATVCLIYRREKIVLFWAGVLILSLIFVLPTFVGQLPFIYKVPFLSTAQPSRLIAVIDFSLVILAAFGLDYYLKNNLKTKIVSTIFVLLTICLWGVAFITNNQIGLRNLVWPTFLLILTLVLVSKPKLIWLLSFIIIFDLARFAIKFESFSSKEWLYPKTQIITFLQNKAKSEIFRIAATDNRIMPPNFSTTYRLQTISGYDPLYLRRYGEFIAAVERDKSDNSVPFGFNRIITPINFSSKFFDLLNVKYVLSFEDIKNNKYRFVLQEGETKLYENTQVCPRVFLAKKVTRIDDDVDVLKAMYEPNYSPCEEAIVTRTSHTPGKIAQGKAEIIKYSDNVVVINAQIESGGEGYLILTDVNYPGWKAEIDNQKTEIFYANYVFRGVKVPPGTHTVRFYYTII